MALLRGVLDALTAPSPPAPVVIGIDDIDLFDDLSVFVVHQVVQQRLAKVLITVRAGDAIPTASRRSSSSNQRTRSSTTIPPCPTRPRRRTFTTRSC